MRRCWCCGQPLAKPNKMLLKELCTACVERRVDDIVWWPEMRGAA